MAAAAAVAIDHRDHLITSLRDKCRSVPIKEPEFVFLPSITDMRSGHRHRAAEYRQTASMLRQVLVTQNPCSFRLDHPRSFPPPVAKLIEESLIGSSASEITGYSSYLNHCFLHALMRSNLQYQAAKLAYRLLSIGARLRNASLEAVIRSLQTPSRTARSVSLRLRILRKARARGYWQTPLIYEAIIQDCCRDNNQLVDATHIFEKLCLDWQVNKCDKLSGSSPSKPTFGMLRPILHAINEVLAADPGDSVRRAAAIKSMYRIILLLEERQLPFPGLSLLIKTLYCLPRTDVTLKVIVHGRSKVRNVYRLAHSTLRRLIESLDRRATNQPAIHLDCDSGNSLLYYALHHRRSLRLAQPVLRYMNDRSNSLDVPSNATCNIIVRTASLLRCNNLAREGLRSLHREQRGRHDLEKFMELLALGPDGKNPSIHPMTAQDLLPITLAEQNRTNDTSLVSYITHVTSLGNPPAVVRLVYQLFPSLHVRTCFNTSLGSHKASAASRKTLMLQSIYKAARLGPHIMTALLNGIAKSLKIGLMERLWYVATQAEVASWQEAVNAEPWVLPIHAYTCMLQAYHRSKALPSGAATMAGRGYVRGWAYSLEGLTNNKRYPRWLAARILGFQVYTSARLTHSKFWDTPNGMKEVTKPHGLPTRIADARFYNAALRLFRREPGSSHTTALLRTRSTRGSVYRRKLGDFVKYGFSPPPQVNPWLQQVLEDIARQDLDIPPHYRELSPILSERNAPSSRNLQLPYAFHRQPFPNRHQPHLLYGPKTKSFRAAGGRAREKPRLDP